MHVVLWALLTLFAALYFGRYSTTFNDTCVQQKRFVSRTQTRPYSEIAGIAVGQGKSANAITIRFVDGRTMTVYGDDKQLIRAQLVLRKRVPELAQTNQRSM